MSLAKIIFSAAISIMAAAFFLAFLRLLRGPVFADRVVALDLMATIGIGFIAAYAVLSNQRVFLDVATVVALLSFLATVAFASYGKTKDK